jgi:hypothetical protein
MILILLMIPAPVRIRVQVMIQALAMVSKGTITRGTAMTLTGMMKTTRAAEVLREQEIPEGMGIGEATRILAPTEAGEAMRIQEPTKVGGIQVDMKARVLMEVQETAAGVGIPVETAVQEETETLAERVTREILEIPGAKETLGVRVVPEEKAVVEEDRASTRVL